MHRRRIPGTGVLLALLLAAPAAHGQQVPAAATAWHIVRPGDTLRGIAGRFLGSQERWPEIHKLNPWITDPDRIEPGARLRMPAVQSTIPAARLSRLSRPVENQPAPIGWGEAQIGDMLVERDGVRTRRKASAEMQFLDGARLVMTEDSLIFLRRSGSRLRGLPGVERQSIEIVEGQADLEARPATGPTAASATAGIEIVLGNTKATSRPDRSGPAQTRARRSEEGGAKLMAYGGESEVEAGGAKVQVPRGMGTSVAAQGPPSPPEPLLPAPKLAAPDWACADPVFAWEPVAGASSYTIELCRDSGCGELVERRTGETAARWQPAGLPKAELYWRVTARAATGLDGYPSEASPINLTAERAAGPPPTGSLQVTGPQVRVGDRLFVSTAAKVEATAVDAAGSPARWVPVVGGQEVAAWPASWAAGEQTIGAMAVDGCGTRGTIAPVAFVVDAAAPAIHWEVHDQQELEEHLAKDTEKERQRLRGRRANRPSGQLAWPSLAGVWKIPVPWVKDKDLTRVADFPVEIASDHPQAFFSAAQATLTVEDKETALGDHRFLWISAEDAEGAGVDRLTFRTRNEGDRVVLEVEAADLVGNVSKKEIVLREAASAERAH